MSMREVAELRQRIDQAAVPEPVLLVELADLLECRMDPDALQAWQDAVQANPNDATTIAKYARYLAGDPNSASDAAVHFKKALDLDNTNSESLRMYANFLVLEPDFGDATGIFQLALAAAPEDSSCLADFAAFLASAADVAAEPIFERAVAADPEDALLHCDFAKFVASTLHDSARARVLFEKAVLLEPRNKAVAGDFGVFLAESEQDNERAEAMFCRSLAGDIVSVSRMVSFAQFLSSNGRFDEAEDWYLKANDFDPHDSNTAFSWACFLAKRGRVDDALNALERTNWPDFSNPDFDSLRHEPRFLALQG